MTSFVKDKAEIKKANGHGGSRVRAGRPPGSPNKVPSGPTDRKELERLSTNLEQALESMVARVPLLGRYLVAPFIGGLWEIARDLKRHEYVLSGHLRGFRDHIETLEFQTEEQAEMLEALHQDLKDATRAGDDRAAALQARITALEAEVTGTRQMLEASEKRTEAHFKRIWGTAVEIKGEVPAAAIAAAVRAGTQDAIRRAIHEGKLRPIPPIPAPRPITSPGTRLPVPN
jgi:hypothetical protein